MRERPILFSGAMVRAIMEGRKTQTRRVLGVQPLEILLPSDRRASSLARVTRKWDGQRVWFALTVRGATIAENRGVAFRCKYGEVGDRLWVRETWMTDLVADREAKRADKVRYRATDDLAASDGMGWRPSIHMPRWASRLTLEVTGVRVERLQDISEGDCWAEGIERSAESPTQASTIYSDYASPRRAFNLLWDSINAKRGFGWDANPWVWVLTFAPIASPVASPSPLAQTSRADD